MFCASRLNKKEEDVACFLLTNLSYLNGNHHEVKEKCEDNCSANPKRMGLVKPDALNMSKTLNISPKALTLTDRVSSILKWLTELYRMRSQLKPAGTMCRESSNSCDLPEFCTGANPHCPANVYLHDGHACYSVEGYCYNGICQTHEQQCITLWGPGR